MKKRFLTLLIALGMLLTAVAGPAMAVSTPLGDNPWLGCSNAPVREERYTTEYGWDVPLYIFPAGTTFEVGVENTEGWLYLTAYDPRQVGDISYGPNYVFYSNQERFAPVSGVVYHLVVSDSMTGYETYITLEDGAASGSGTEQVPGTGTAEQPSDWAAEAVDAGISAGIVPESLRAQYGQATTRAEFCALAVGLYETVTGTQITQRVSFSDTSDVNVEKMAAVGVVNGVGDGLFEPGRTLTREEAATMLSRLAAALGKPLSAQAPAFVDNGSVSSWAYDAVGQMQYSGVMGGVGENRFAPAEDYTREQSIVTIMRLYDIVK